MQRLQSCRGSYQDVSSFQHSRGAICGTTVAATNETEYRGCSNPDYFECVPDGEAVREGYKNFHRCQLVSNAKVESLADLLTVEIRINIILCPLNVVLQSSFVPLSFKPSSPCASRQHSIWRGGVISHIKAFITGL